MLALNCSVQQYAWGKPGRDSRVAQYKASSDAAFTLAEEENYAELWMGTHPKAPAMLAADGSALTQWLQEYPAMLGTDELEENMSLPFLFKILSINKALSVQSHPDKALAERLHAERPDVYKDPNHKPEFGLALTPFEGMCDFRSLAEIAEHLEEHREFRTICGNEAAEGLEAAMSGNESIQKEALKALFAGFMAADESVKTEQLEAFVARLGEEEAAAVDGPPEVSSPSKRASRTQQEARLRKLMLRLNKDFPGDAGCMVPLLLNYLTLDVGQGFFMGANKPHAYISGDILEIMACSDNVVRVALTPKYRDVDTLVDMLTYESGVPTIDSGSPIDAYTRVFSPPVYECELDVTAMSAEDNQTPYTMRALQSCSIFVVTDLAGTVTATASAVDGVPHLAERAELKLGETYLIPANVGVTLSGESPDAAVALARAHTNPSVAKA